MIPMPFRHGDFSACAILTMRFVDAWSFLGAIQSVGIVLMEINSLIFVHITEKLYNI